MIETLYLRSTSKRPPLKIGVMIDSNFLLPSFAEVLRHIQKSNFAQLALVIRNAGKQDAPVVKGSKLARLIRAGLDARKRADIVYSKYHNWDVARHKGEEHSLFDSVDCTELLAEIPAVDVTPVGKGYVDRFPVEAIEAIKAYDLDVIFRFGFRILRGDVLKTARHGVWSYHHGDGNRFRGSPPAFWEIKEREPLSGAMLQVLTEELDAGVILAISLAATEQGISAYKNALAPYRAAEPLAIEKLKQLHEQGWDALIATAPAKQEYSGRKTIYRSPGVFELSHFVAREVFDHGLRRVGLKSRIGTGYWRTAVRRTQAGNTPPPWQGDWSDFRWVDPANRFIADPQLIEHERRTWMFVERLVVATNKGQICCAELHDDGSVGPFEVALERPYHLSLPFLFKHDGAIFMIPEAAESGRVELFIAVNFPNEWKLERVLLDMPGLDTVLHVGEDGGFYFFTSFRHKPAAHPNLFLFKASGLFEPWQLHAASPLSRDARYARNAGAIVEHAGQLYRPSQDLTGFYGRQMHFHRIVRLNSYDYAEELVGSRAVSPGWPKAIIGTHTYARTAKWEAIDGYVLGLPSSYE
jgi:hypothetical protein